MLPLSLGIGEGAEVYRGMAITVMWGLSVSTLLTLIVIPILYTMTEDLINSIIKFFKNIFNSILKFLPSSLKEKINKE